MLLAEYLNGQFSLLQNLDFILRITVACLCGALIGFERSKRYKEAGIRTHIIVCFAAASLSPRVSSERASIWIASIAAFFAPFTATVATGMPEGI